MPRPTPLTAVTDIVKAHPAVEEVVMHREMIDAINSTIDTITLALLIVAAALLLISVALINNTVRLSVYSRRFTIHTMKLVGQPPDIYAAHSSPPIS